MTELSVRIRAVVEERLRLAREAAAASYGSWAEDSSFFADLLDPLPSQKREHPGYVPMITREDVRHIAANDPADAILSAEHALGILERHAPLLVDASYCNRCVDCDNDNQDHPCDEIRALATRWRVEVDG